MLRGGRRSRISNTPILVHNLPHYLELVCDRMRFAGWSGSKPDRTSAIQRKTRQRLSAEFCATLSPVRFEGKSRLIAAISCDFHDNAAGFLCNSDCLAEREGFEPPIPFQVCRFSRPVPSTTRPPLRLLRSFATPRNRKGGNCSTTHPSLRGNTLPAFSLQQGSQPGA